MRIQLPPEWAGKHLAACVIGGDPFRVAFDDQAQAVVTPEQGAHLQAHSGLVITVLPEDDAEAPLTSEPVADPTPSPEVPPAEVLTPAKLKAKQGKQG